jgi:hypothetical protein
VRIAVCVVAAMVLLGACGDGSDPGPVVEGTEIARSTTTTIPPAPHLESTSTVPVELLPPTQLNRSDTVSKLSWEGQRFDIGVIKKVAQSSDGGWVLAFDREEVVDSHGTRSGKELTANPIDVRQRPPVVRNGNHTITLFNVAPDAAIQEAEPVCASGDAPAGLADQVSDLSTYGVGTDQLDSLTFDASGQVVSILLTHPC